MQENLPIRKRIRIRDYDYSRENIYFITICIKGRLELLGKMVKQNINKIEELYDNAIIDEYTIMPNHIHILLEIKYKNDVSTSKIIKHYKTKEYIQNNVINWKNDRYF